MGFPPLWSRRLYSRDPQLISAKPAEASLLRQEVILKLVALNGWLPPGIIQGTENEKKGATDEKRHQTEEKCKSDVQEDSRAMEGYPPRIYPRNHSCGFLRRRAKKRPPEVTPGGLARHLVLCQGKS